MALSIIEAHGTSMNIFKLGLWLHIWLKCQKAQYHWQYCRQSQLSILISIKMN